MDPSPSLPPPRRRGISLTTQIFIGLALGVIAKWEGDFVEASDAELELAAARGEI
jgi:hypothetical protein